MDLHDFVSSSSDLNQFYNQAILDQGSLLFNVIFFLFVVVLRLDENTATSVLIVVEHMIDSHDVIFAYQASYINWNFIL